MVYAGNEFNSVDLTLDKGIDGLNNLADIEDGFVLDARNVDLSSPGMVQKRAGYHLYGCQLPARVKEITVVYNGGTLEYDSMDVQMDFVPKYSRTIQIWLNSFTGSAIYGDARFRQVANTSETCFVRIKDYSTNPNTNTVSTSDVLEIIVGALSVYVQPIAVFDNNTFIVPRAPLNAAGLSPNTGTGAATERECRFGSGPYFQSLTESDIDDLYVTPTKDEVWIYAKDASALDIREGAIVNLQTGIAETFSTVRSGYVTSIDYTTNIIIVALRSLASTDGTKSTSYFKMYYTNGYNCYYKSQSVELLVYSDAATNVSVITSCNSLTAGPKIKALSGTTSATFTDIGFIYGLDTVLPPANLLAYFYDLDLDKNRLLCGYGGNVFVETEQPDTIYNTIITPVLASQTVTVNSSGVGSITVPDSSYYEVDDVVYLEFSADTTWEVTTYEFTVTAKPTGISLTVSNTDYASTSIAVPIYSKLRFARTDDTIIFRKESYDEVPRVFPGVTFQTDVGKSYATHKVLTSYYSDSTTNTITTVNDLTWNSDSTISLGNLFLPVNYPDSSTLDNYEPILTSYFPDTRIDLSHALIDRNVYIAAQKDGMWKYNGSELTNLYLPTPPTPLATNVPGTYGNLKIVEDQDGVRFGHYYNLVVTYSYFEFVNGILKEVESGVTAAESTVVQAVPAGDGSFNSQLIEVQVKTIPREIGLPADNVFINVYRTIDGVVDGVLDAQLFYREVSKLNDPDTPYVTLYVGNLTSTLLENNGQILYASIATDVKDEQSRNKRTPPLANHIINFQNRVIAFNGREKPYFNLVCNDVFDSSSLTLAFGANGLLNFVPADSDITDYRFCLCPCDETTTNTSVLRPSGTQNIRYQVFSMEQYDIQSVSYNDQSFQVLLDYDANITASLIIGDKVILKAVSRDNYDTEFDGFNFDDQILAVISPAAATPTPAVLYAEKRWTASVGIGSDIPNNYMVFKYSEGTNTSGNCQLIVTNSLIQLINVAATGSAYDNKFIIIRGADIGTLAQMKDKNDAGYPNSRIYDFNTDVIFYAEETASGSGSYNLTPHKIVGQSAIAGITATQALAYHVDIDVTNIGLVGAIEGVSHGSIDIYVTTSASSTYDFLAYPKEVQIADALEELATVTIPTATADLGLVNGDLIVIDEIPFDTRLSKIPNENGLDFNGTHLVNSYTYGGGVAVSTLSIYVEPTLNLFSNFTDYAVSGKFITPTQISFASTYMQISYPTGAQALTIALEAGQWVYAIAKTRDELKHSLQISGWFQILQVSIAAGVWVSSANSGNLYGIRIAMNGDAVNQNILSGVANLKILACRVNGGTAGGTVSYVPVPVPTTPTDFITGSMFGPLDGQTPYERVVKPLGTAISTVMASEGFAYWGADPGDIEEFPVNGFKFINHKWPNNKYTNARDTSITFYDENKYSLLFDFAADYYKWRANSGLITSIGTNQTDDFLEERYPSRVWWTTPDTIAFRDLSQQDITSEDGEEIIGAVPFEEYFLVFKESQIFKVKIEETGLIVDRVQARIGAVSKKNIVGTDSGCIFTAKSGFFYTDGNSVKKIVRLNRIFRDYVKKNESLFPFMAGGYDPTNYEIRLGAPIADSIDASYTDYDRHFQLNFNLKDVESGISGSGWSVNTGISANNWLHVDESMYFGSTDGSVYRIRSEYAASKYRDDESAINMKIDTRFFDFGSPEVQKFLREIVMQLDTKYDNSISVSQSWNFRSVYEAIGTVSLDISALSSDDIGDRYTASAKYIESRRQSSDPMRVLQASFRLENSTIDQSGGIHGLWAHVNAGPRQGVRQQ